MIACITPGTAAGNTLPLLLGDPMSASESCLLVANINSLAFLIREKLQQAHAVSL
jgi:hypothetical protein